MIDIAQQRRMRLAAMDRLRSETCKAYAERPESEVIRQQDGQLRPPRAPGTAGMTEGVRYQMYKSSDVVRAVHGVRAVAVEELLRSRPCRPELAREVARLHAADVAAR
ncbi:hypothetical protein ACU686_03145 [Yinghuangia aomiensis]